MGSKMAQNYKRKKGEGSEVIREGQNQTKGTILTGLKELRIIEKRNCEEQELGGTGGRDLSSIGTFGFADEKAAPKQS